MELEELQQTTTWLWLAANPGWTYVAIGLIAFIESLAVAGVVVPGVVMLAAVAALAGATGLSLTLCLSMAFAGAVLGDGVSFALGRYSKDHVHGMWPFTRHPEFLSHAEGFFRRHGALAIVIGRFIGPLRPVMPLTAGMFGMNPVRFLAINFTSAIAWAPVYILPGFLAGTAVTASFSPPTTFYVYLAFVAAWGVAAFYGIRWCARQLQWGTPAQTHLLHADQPLLAGIAQRVSPHAADTWAAVICTLMLATAAIALTFWITLSAPVLSEVRLFVLSIWHTIQ